MTYFYEEQCYPVQLKVRKNVLEYAYYLAVTGGYIRTIKLRYNDDAGMMQVIGYDSGYRLYRNLGGYCTKSYNLLTGDFKVINELFTSDNSTSKRERHNGNHPISDKYIDSINEDLFQILDRVGAEYEID